MSIEIKQIQKSFGRKSVLTDVSFVFEPGNCIGIIGANGCGKSTLFSILAGVQPGKGSFFVNGLDLMNNRKKREALLGYIPQGTPLIPELTARDNLKLWFSPEEMKQSVSDGLIRSFGVHEFLSVPVRKMSGGMKKRLSIVCAVAHDPQIIIMDEPTASLDIVCKQTIATYISSCKSEGKSVLIATHEEQELQLCDRVYVLKNGVVEPFNYSGNVLELVERIQ